MQADETSSLAELRGVLIRALDRVTGWDERFAQANIPTSSEAAAFRADMTRLHLRAQVEWHRYCENFRLYEIAEY